MEPKHQEVIRQISKVHQVLRPHLPASPTPAMERSTLVGVLFCITGNVLISLGLNYQKTSRYLKSYKWWLGFCLMTLGEIENFIAYGFLRIVLVSSLGIITLISNIIILPIFFNQPLKLKDLLGTLVASLGVVVIILSLSSDDTLVPDPVDYFHTTVYSWNFLGYLVASILALSSLISKKDKSILHHLAIVAVFGSYTVIATKLLSMLVEDSFAIVVQSSIPFLLLVVIVITSYLQISYLNRALKLNSSTVVIPLHYIFFNLTIILSSLVVFQEFSETTPLQTVLFFVGISFAFVGVMMISGFYEPDSPSTNVVTPSVPEIAIDDSEAEPLNIFQPNSAVEATPGILQRAKSTSQLLLRPIKSLQSLQNSDHQDHQRRISDPLMSYGSFVVGSGLIVNTVMNYSHATTDLSPVEVAAISEEDEYDSTTTV